MLDGLLERQWAEYSGNGSLNFPPLETTWKSPFGPNGAYSKLSVGQLVIWHLLLLYLCWNPTKQDWHGSLYVCTQILRAFYSTRKQHPRDSKWLAPKRLHYNYVDSVVWSPPMRRRNRGKVITILAENQYRNCENTAKGGKSVQLNFILQLWAIAFSQVRSIEELEVYL